MTQIDRDDPERNRSGLVFGMIVLGLGVIFLLRNYGILDWFDFWPWILIVIGVALVVSHLTRRP